MSAPDPGPKTAAQKKRNPRIREILSYAMKNVRLTDTLRLVPMEGACTVPAIRRVLEGPLAVLGVLLGPSECEVVMNAFDYVLSWWFPAVMSVRCL